MIVEEVIENGCRIWILDVPDSVHRDGCDCRWVREGQLHKARTLKVDVQDIHSSDCDMDTQPRYGHVHIFTAGSIKAKIQ